MRQGYAIHRLTRGVGDTWFLAANGRRWFRMDERRQDVALRDIPADLQHAFVAVEDHRFYHHPGVDPIALGRAIFRNATEPGSLEGGSTLTQQLARTLFLSNRKTYARKLHEAVLALMIDAQLSKDQILELYLNRIYLSAGVYGVETMSRHLFGKPAKQLTLAESALIAGLARAPAALSPWNHLEDAVARSHVVLARMRDEGFITPAQEQAARRARIRVQPYPGAVESQAGYAKDYLRQLFRDSFGGDHPPDWDVQTTFVPELQDMAERAVSDGLRRFGDPELQAALVAIDPETGDVLAMVGGRDFKLSQFNRASRSRRQPGSAFKPLLYATALEHGFSPVSVLSDLGHVAPQGPEEWSPRNAEADAPDTLTLRAALFESDNRAATVLQQRVGTRAVLSLANHVGLRDMPDVPSLSLGTGLVTPLDLTAAFTMFPSGGLVAQPRGIVRVIDADGSTALDNPRADRAGHLRRDGVSDGLDAERCRSTAEPDPRPAPRACASPSAARPAPPTSSRTLGSSASPHPWWSACGWGSTSRRRSAGTPSARATRCRSGATSCAAPHACGCRRRSNHRRRCATSRSAASRI